MGDEHDPESVHLARMILIKAARRIIAEATSGPSPFDDRTWTSVIKLARVARDMERVNRAGPFRADEGPDVLWESLPKAYLDRTRQFHEEDERVDALGVPMHLMEGRADVLATTILREALGSSLIGDD